METAAVKVNTRLGTILIDKPLYLGATYALEFDGYDGGDATLIIYRHGGDPVARSETEDGATTISLDTEPLLEVFKSHGVRCPAAVTLHACLTTGSGVVAQSDVPVFYTPYFNFDGQPARIDVTGPQGPPGTAAVIAPLGLGFVGFDVGTDETHPDGVGHLWAHGQEASLYATDASGNLILDGDGNPLPLWTIEDGRLKYHFYHNGREHQVMDLGAVRDTAGLFTFEVDEQGHLICTANDPREIYATDASGNPLKSCPRWVLGDGTGGTTAGHLYYVVYTDGGAVAQRLDVGMVKGADGQNGQNGQNGQPGQDGQRGVGIDSIFPDGQDDAGGNKYLITLTDGSSYTFVAPKGPAYEPTLDDGPTAGSSNPAKSGGIAQAIADAATGAVASAKTYTDTAVASAVSSVYKFKGSVEYYDDLPASGNKTGDVYNVENAYGDVKAGTNFAWNGTGWDALGGEIAIDSSLDTTSGNPIANAPVATAIANLGERGYITVLNNGRIQAVIPE